LFKQAVVEDAGGDDRMVAGKGSGDIGDAFACPDAELARLQVDGMAAELRRGKFHRVARSRARLLEVERDALVLEQGAGCLLR
jgi:hypothetical protein